MRILWLLLVASCLFSCKKTKESSVVKIKGTYYPEQVKIIPLRLEEANGKTKLSELIDTSDFSVIPLETTNESIFGTDIACKVFDGRVYIQDNQQNVILAFSETGKFLGKVDKQGKGPDRYEELKDFIVQEDSIMILDYTRILYYNRNNFNFIKSKNLSDQGIFATVMAKDDSSYYFLNLDFSPTNSSMVICDKNFKIKAAMRDPSYGKKRIATAPIFFQMAGEMYYHHAYNDTLYRPTSEGLEVKYIWDCGERALNLDQYLNLPTPANSRYPIRKVPKHYFYRFGGYTYADSILYFSGINGENTYRCFYSLISGKIKMLTPQNMVDDVFGMNVKIYTHTSENDYFYNVIYPYILTKDKRPRTEGPFAGRTEDDNPVVLKFKYRKF